MILDSTTMRPMMVNSDSSGYLSFLGTDGDYYTVKPDVAIAIQLARIADALERANSIALDEHIYGCDCEHCGE